MTEQANERTILVSAVADLHKVIEIPALPEFSIEKVLSKANRTPSARNPSESGVYGGVKFTEKEGFPAVSDLFKTYFFGNVEPSVPPARVALWRPRMGAPLLEVALARVLGGGSRRITMGQAWFILTSGELADPDEFVNNMAIFACDKHGTERLIELSNCIASGVRAPIARPGWELDMEKTEHSDSDMVFGIRYVVARA